MAEQYTTRAFGRSRWIVSTARAAAVSVPGRSALRFFAQCDSSNRRQPS